MSVRWRPDTEPFLFFLASNGSSGKGLFAKFEDSGGWNVDPVNDVHNSWYSLLCFQIRLDKLEYDKIINTLAIIIETEKYLKSN